jgi:hypothetical protein
MISYCLSGASPLEDKIYLGCVFFMKLFFERMNFYETVFGQKKNYETVFNLSFL